MFLLTMIVAACNLVLGYALAVWLGWANMPNLPKKASGQTAVTDPHTH
jgi:hypothetical protein